MRMFLACAVLAVGCSTGMSQTKSPEVDAVTIEGARYTLEKAFGMPSVSLKFTVVNGGKTAIRRVYFHGVVQSPGEKKKLELNPVMSEWRQVPPEFLKDVALKVTVKSFEDAAGKKYGGE